MFQGNVLGACQSMDYPDGIFEFRVNHFGSDGWCMDSVILEFTGGLIFGCHPGMNAGYGLDNEQTYTCDR